jgi:hypothetical protein
MKRFLLLVTVMALVGCATTPVDTAVAKSATSERLLAFQQKTPNTTATLIVTRDDAFAGSGCYCALYINGIFSARLGVRETSRFHLEPGEIVLRVGSDPQGSGTCSFFQEGWIQRETILKPGQIKYFRIMTPDVGIVDIQRSDY